MIQFPCLGCRQVFSVSDDEAGRSIQCHLCGRLNDVPSHSDLKNLAEDGTIKLVEPDPPAGADSDRLAEVTYIYQNARVDEDGDEIDLRNTAEDSAAIDGPIDPGTVRRQRYKPYYDPETGELIRPFELQPDPIRDVDPRSIPIAVPASMAADHSVVIDYARRDDPGLLKTHRPLWRLLEPGNLAVMFFVLFGLALGYVAQLLFISVIEQTFDVPVWPLNVMFWLMVAHFGNTIVAIGPEEHDDLPRPLLSLGLWDDILGPLSKVLAAALLCYAPMFAALALVHGTARISALPLMLIGGYYFPAVVLTVLTSGNLMNLHPHRLHNVIRIGGWRYVRNAVAWIILFPVYLWATLRVNLVFSSLGIKTPRYNASEILAAGPAMIVCVFFLHYLCWQLGLLFRAGHERFGWVWQELQRQREEDRRKRGALTVADRAAMRRQRQVRASSQAVTQPREGPK